MKKVLSIAFLLIFGFSLMMIRNLSFTLYDKSISSLLSFTIGFLSLYVIPKQVIVKNLTLSALILISPMFLVQFVNFQMFDDLVYLSFPTIFGFLMSYSIRFLFKNTFVRASLIFLVLGIYFTAYQIFIPKIEYYRSSENIEIKTTNYWLQYANNTIIESNHFNNKIVIYNFWFMNCGFCHKTFETIDKLNSEYINNPNVLILNIDIRDDDMLRVNKYIAQKKFTSGFVFDKSKKLQKQLGITICPQVVIVDKSGVAKKRIIGYSKDLKRGFLINIKKDINTLLTHEATYN